MTSGIGDVVSTIGLLVVMLAGLVLAAVLGAALLGRWAVGKPPTRRTYLISGLVLLAAVPVTVLVGRLAAWDALARWDEQAYTAMASGQNDLITRTMAAVTGIGSITSTGFIAIVVGLIVGYWKRNVWLAVLPPTVFFVSLHVQRFTDALDPRPGPSDAVSIGAPGGFPSGGTARVIVVVGIIAVILAQHWRGTRERAVLGAALGAIAWIEIISRLVLGRHWPLDLLGGAVAGAMLLTAVGPLLWTRDATADRAPADGAVAQRVASSAG